MAGLDVAVAGAGFAGIYAVHALRSAGLTVRAFEAGSGIGGTWFWNRCPGARCGGVASAGCEGFVLD